MRVKILILIIIVIGMGGAVIFWQKVNAPALAPDLKEGEETSTLPENKLIALGSSLTLASNLSGDKQGENEEYSFSVGTKINSLYLYLKNTQEDLSFVNLASPGAEMRDILERQLSQALSYNPKYISMDPGADIVVENSIQDFKQYLSAIIQRISTQTTIFLFTYPDFETMRTASYSSCLENKVGVNLESLSKSNILAFNQAIKEVTSGKDNIVLIDIYDLLGPDDVSDYDCLHINIEGQKKIADEFIKILDSK